MSEKLSIKKIMAIGFGANILEWYDFSIYAYLSSILGTLFFDESQPTLALIKALFVFSLSFLVRPLGSIFFGYLSDRYGRRVSLQLSLVLMAFPTLFIGLLPVYSSIGNWAIALLIIFRMIQGFAAGGELPSVTCYLYEIAPQNQRNFYCSFGATSSILGIFLGSFVVYCLHLFFTGIEIQNWAWRIPFWLGSFMILIVFQIRRSLVETNSFKPDAFASIKEYAIQLIDYKKELVQIFSLNIFVSTAFYLLFVWMPSYLTVFNHVPANFAFFSSSFGLLALALFTLIIGFVAQDTHRKNWLMLGLTLIILLSYPLFKVLEWQSINYIFIIQLIFAAIYACVSGVINATMGSVFNDTIRCSGISIAYTLPTAIFGGILPTLCSILIYQTGLKTFPVVFLLISALIGLFAAFKLPT